MKLQHLFVAAISAVFLSGCATPLAPLNFSVPNVGLSQKKIDAEMKSLNVSIARPDEQTGKIPPEISVTFPQLWTSALTDALNKMAIFQDDATKKINLSVKILKIDIPGAGASMTTETAARYEIMDRKTGDLIRDIILDVPTFSPYTVSHRKEKQPCPICPNLTFTTKKPPMPL